jgi:hypothetical protein
MMALPVKKRDAKKVAAKPVRDTDIQVPIVTRKQDRLHRSDVPFGYLRDCIGYTLGKNFIYHVRGDTSKILYGNQKRVNAEAAAEDIARALMYEDGGFRITEHGDDPKLCKKCKAKGEEE